MKYLGIIVILGYLFVVIIMTIRNILIGNGKIKHAMYDNDKKLKSIFRKGIISLSLALIGGGLIISIMIFVILGM